jgi:hypothetical protein
MTFVDPQGNPCLLFPTYMGDQEGDDTTEYWSYRKDKNVCIHGFTENTLLAPNMFETEKECEGKCLNTGKTSRLFKVPTNIYAQLRIAAPMINLISMRPAFKDPKQTYHYGSMIITLRRRRKLVCNNFTENVLT